MLPVLLVVLDAQIYPTAVDAKKTIISGQPTYAFKIVKQDTIPTKQLLLVTFVSTTALPVQTTKTVVLVALLIRDNLMTAHLDVNLCKVITKAIKELRVSAIHNVKHAVLSVFARPVSKDSSSAMVPAVLLTVLLAISQTTQQNHASNVLKVV